MSTRKSIVDAAAATFAEEGYNGATLAKVGQRLGLTKSAVLYHFASKEQLLDEVLTPITQANRALVSSYDAPPETLDGRLEVLRQLLDLYAEHPAACLAMENDRMLWRHGSLAVAMHDNYTALVRLLSGPGSQPDAERRAHTALLVAFRASTVGLDMAGAMRDPESFDDTLRLCADILRG